jgi:prepilin-type processing-associated H-X9-DG protein/prepilin-type N-terminal cleavage/methylation domain-containing protein
MLTGMRRTAFTLLELLVVLTCIALLASLVLAGTNVVRSAATSVRCAANLRQLGVAFGAYGNDWEQRWPAPLNVAGVFWNMALWDALGHESYATTLANNPLALQRGVLTCPLLTSTVPVVHYCRGYGMTGSLPPVDAGVYIADAAAARKEHPQPGRFRCAATTPVLADSVTAYNLAVGRPQGDWFIGSFNAFGTTNLVGYPHRQRSTMLFADGHVSAVIFSQLGDVVVQVPVNPPAPFPTTF